jgi:hyperosmotically inducible periplasmic protein
MTRRTLFAPIVACLVFALTTPSLIAQAPQPAAPASQEEVLSIANVVQKKIAGLTNYSVFDWITFGIQGSTRTLILKGYASRPVLKDDIARAVKGVEGITTVDNQIKVLPLSNNDDRIRAAVYNRIFTQPALRKYNANQGSIGRAIGPGAGISLAAGGVTNTPPIGFHAIHIIVNNGHVTLYGTVLNKGDSDIAGMQANGTPGTFSVENDITVQGEAAKPAAK